ncbi:MAG TPA: isoprenylcysteine carboxylmethyltransferase family protein [Vicinamibacterales bacterium]|nr:isoprenylcysteine carboxylmethyltransferase family protein [Vicinamibacterales bacterium]
MFKRSLFFVYGVASYLVFLGTFLYAIAFVGGFAVPRRLDGPLQTSLLSALAIDCVLLTIFAVQHSVMARRWFKERWTQIVPWTIERSTFVLAASLALLLLFWQWRPIGVQIWSVENPTARIALWTLFAAGWGTVLVVTFLINHFDLFGLRQVWLPLVGKPYTRVNFRTPMPYRFVRHPLYLGFLFAFWMTPNMTLAHLVFAVATTAYIVLAIQFEERDLVHEHGATYEQYRRSVPMLLPGRRRTLTGRAPTGRAGATSIVAVIALATAWQMPARAQDDHSHTPSASALVKIVRESTERFKDVAVAEAAGYALQFGCVSGPDSGAMGLHYVNFPLVLDGELDATRPEIVIYEPLPNGGLQLVGADYLVLADAWHAKHSGPPQLVGQLLHLFEAPNRFGLPAFYTLHVWAWKESPTGTFVNWHKNISCDAFGGGDSH